jgi:hypothetical protein
MQKQTFTNGGYVVHGMTGIISTHKVSAWFDSEGNLLECQAIHLHSLTAKAIPAKWGYVRSVIARRGKSLCA